MWKRFATGAFGIVFVVGAVSLVQALIRHRVPDAVGATLVAVVALAAYVAHVHYVERRSVDELAPARLPQAAAGFALGAGLFAATMLVLAALGVYRSAGFVSWEPLAQGFGVMVAAGVIEELIFRGFIVRWVQSTAGTWIAIAVSALLFGAVHAANPGATPLSSAAIALEAGVLLSVAYVVSGNLWFPIGIHIGWNFTEGPIFGVAVSGNSVSGAVRGSVQGPAFLTGGAFGVEASIVAVIVCTLAAAALWIGLHGNDRVRPPMWRTGFRPRLPRTVP
jgi:membrane protease YdiL (CAAX protease family)